MSVWDTAAMPQLNSRANKRRGRRQWAGEPARGSGGGQRREALGAAAALRRLGPEGLTAGALLAVVVLLLAAFVLGAIRVGAGVEAWLAAAGLALIVASGLLYALRLGASGPR